MGYYNNNVTANNKHCPPPDLIARAIEEQNMDSNFFARLLNGTLLCFVHKSQNNTKCAVVDSDTVSPNADSIVKRGHRGKMLQVGVMAKKQNCPNGYCHGR